MKKLSYILMFTVLTFSLTSCWENVEDLAGSGPSVKPGVKFVLSDGSGTRVGGATVEVYGSYADFIHSTNVVASGTADSNGEIEFGTDDLGTESASFWVSAYSSGYTLVNWNGTVKTPLLLLTSGKTPVALSMTAPAYSAAITGPTAVVSGSSHGYSLKDYPGTYTWSSSSLNATFSDASVPKPTVSFAQNDADESITLSVDIVTGTSTVTLETTVEVSRFCDYVAADWNGAFMSGVDRGGTGSTYGTNGMALSVTGNSVVFPANDSGDPWFMTSTFAGWTEKFQAGFGNEGDIMATFADNGAVTIPEQYWGRTLPGPYDYWVRGSGTFDQCTMTVTITSLFVSYYDDYSGGTTRASEAQGNLVLTLSLP